MLNFSWMLGFVVIRGKKIVVGSGPNCTHEVTTSIKRSGDIQVGYNTTMLFPNIAFCSGVYFPYWPLFFAVV